MSRLLKVTDIKVHFPIGKAGFSAARLPTSER